MAAYTVNTNATQEKVLSYFVARSAKDGSPFTAAQMIQKLVTDAFPALILKAKTDQPALVSDAYKNAATAVQDQVRQLLGVE